MGLVGGRGRRHRATVLLPQIVRQHPRAAAGRDPELARSRRLPSRPGRQDQSSVQGLRVHPVPGSPQPGLSVGALAYDAIASSYDAQVQGDAWMREVLHRHFTRVFHAGDRVLDVGCGTGLDAVFLAERGIEVVAIDFSPEMVAQCRAKATAAGLADRVDARVLPIADLCSLRDEQFDGLISAFAGLNTLPDLNQFAADASRLVKPGGHLILHLLNRFSLWEWLGYVSHANGRAARDVGRRRTRNFTIGGRAVPHTVYYANEAYAR